MEDWDSSLIEESELFLINPAQINIQIDLRPRAGEPDSVRNDSMLTATGAGVGEELKMEHGRDFPVEVNPVTPYLLKGVQYAAHRFVRYKLGETRVSHGWVYGFSEPYQLFIIYMVLEKEGSKDLEEAKKIIDSFEMVSKK
jgi:hypothetical protein